MSVTVENVQKALQSVIDPNTGKDLITTKSVKNIKVENGDVTLDVILGYPAKSQIDLIRKSVIAGLRDLPGVKNVSPNVTMNIVAHSVQRGVSLLPNVKNIIAISSGKGGVGKSTVTANLAVSLAKMGFSVGVLDADIYGPSMPIMFDVENEKPISIELEGKSKMKPIESYEVKLLSIGFFTSPSQAVIWRGPMAAKALNQMIFDAHWGELDFMLIDLPPGTGDIHLSIMQSLPITGAVVVSTPQNVALADAKKGVAMFLSDAINVPVLGIIENMAYFTPEELPNNKYYIFGQEGAKNLAEDLKVPFLGEVPLVQSIREAGDYGRPAALQTASVLESVFENITRNVVQETVSRNETLPPTEAIKITTMAGCSAVKGK